MSTLVANRIAKATKLADVVEQHLPKVAESEAVIEAVAKMPAAWWADVADEAGTKPPSVETIQCVCTALRERMRTEDPFACFARDLSK